MNETICPHCGRVNEAHAGPTPDALPEPGDVSICWACRGLALFTDSGVRKPTDEEKAELEKDPAVRAAVAAAAEAYTPSQASDLRWRST